MPGVLMEIDLALAKQAVDRATKDAEVAGQRIGQAIGNSPAVKNAAFQLGQALAGELAPNKAVAVATRYVSGLERTLQLAQADIREAQVRGLITPAQAHERGVAAARAFNVGVLGQIKTLGSGGALSGRAGQDVFIDLSSKLKNVGTQAEASTKGLNTVRGGLLALAAQATNTSGPLGSVANGLLAFAGGGPIILAAVAGLALLAKGYELLTRKSREAAEGTKALFDRLDQAIKARLKQTDPGRALFPEFETLNKEIEQIDRKLAEARKGRTVREKGELVRLSPDAEAIAGLEAERATTLARIVELNSQLRDLVASQATALKETEGPATVRVKSATKLRDIEKEIDALLKEEGKRQLEIAAAEQQRAEAEAQRQVQLAGDRDSLMADLQRRIAATTPTVVDDLELELHALQTQIIQTFGAVPAEVQPLLDDYRKRIREAKEETKGVGDAVPKIATDWEAVGNTIATVAQGILDLANSMGILDERMSKVVQGAIGLGRNLPKALTGDPTAIFGAASGAVSVLSGVFGGGDSPEVTALKQAIKANEAALRDNTRVLEVSGGAAGFSSTSKALDEILTGKYKLLQGPADYEISRDELDIALRKEGSSFRELEAAANDLGIDISILTDKSLAQLQEKMGDVDIAAIREAEAQEALAVSMGAAADSMARARTQAEQWSDLLDTDDPLTAAQQRLGARGAAGGVGSSERRALGEIANLDLGSEAGRTIADRLLKEKFANAETLTAEQRGGLSVDAFRDLLVEWEGILDEIRANEADTRRNNEQEAVNQRTEAEQQAAFADLQKRAGVLGGPAAQAAADAARLIAEAIALEGAAPVGGSPLAEDARRRADAAVSEAERLVDAGEQARGDKITPGFTVSRIITETSAGRLIGELTTQTIYLKDIRDLIAGGRPVGTITDGGGAAGVPVIENHLYIDGRELSDVVSTRQFQSYQTRTGLQGNAGSRS